VIEINNLKRSLEITDRKINEKSSTSMTDLDKAKSDTAKFKEMTGLTSSEKYEAFLKHLEASDQMCRELIQIISNSELFIDKLAAQVDELIFILSGSRNIASTINDLVSEFVTHYKRLTPEFDYPKQNTDCLLFICEKENQKNYSTVPQDIWYEIIEDMDAIVQIFTSTDIDEWLKEKFGDETTPEKVKEALKEIKDECDSEIKDKKMELKTAEKDEKPGINQEIKELEKVKKQQIEAFTKDIEAKKLKKTLFSKAVKLLRGSFHSIKQNIISPIQKKTARLFFTSFAPNFIPIYIEYNKVILTLTKEKYSVTL